MLYDLIVAGFGGQGVMTLGQMLAYAGLEEGKNVLWMPAYGPETRGGFANCTVIFSDEEIASPVVSNPDSMIIMNRPSLEKFENTIKPKGLMILNTSMVNREVERKDIEVIKVPATDIASELGNTKVANMVALGAYAEKTKIVKIETIVSFISKKLKDKTDLIEINKKALARGAETVKSCAKCS
ncbi:MAG: 2-oxoacid:acceptor oxidoreductase family protein [Armatimonadota bacterium]